jgi:hypothetical protein
MELDHVFIFTESPEQVASSLHSFGLIEGSPNTHPGQGTACRRFFFENAYLELVWVSSEEEVKSQDIAETQLWQRSQYRKTHYCPFGICFRNSNSENNSGALIFEDGWKYKPPYIPEGIYVNVASNTNYPAEPMLFEMPFFRRTPKDYSPERIQPLNHARGFTEITKVILALPTTVENLSPSMRKVIDDSIVAILPKSNFSVTVEFDHCLKGATQDFNPLIPLSVRW